MEKILTCADQVKKAFKSRSADIIKLYNANNQETKELGRLYEYGLSIDKVEAGTFEGQRENYARYQLSWGGPSEEFRLYQNGEMEFWFMDWGDGAKIDIDQDEEIYFIIKDLIEVAIGDDFILTN